MPNEYNIHQQVIIGITSGLLALTTLVVYARIYARCVIVQSNSAGWDDVTVVIAWIMAVGTSIATYFEVMFGLGRHTEELTTDQVYSFSVSLFVMVQFYNVGNSTVKLSFLAQYLRLFRDPGMRRVCILLGMFTLIWMFAQAVLYSFSCVLITGVIQDKTVATVCIPSVPLSTALSSINAFTSLMIFYIPFKPVWDLPLLKRQKSLVFGIFCVGFIVCIISIVRIPDLRRAVSSPDPTFAKVAMAGLAVAELDIAIVCTSLPVLRPLVARFINGITPADALSHRNTDRSIQQTRCLNRMPSGSKSIRSDCLSGTTLEFGDQTLSRSKPSWMSLNRELERDDEKPPAVPSMTNYPTKLREKPLPDIPAGYGKTTVTEKPVPRPPLKFYPRVDKDTLTEKPIARPPHNFHPLGSELPPIRAMSPFNPRYSSVSPRHTSIITMAPPSPGNPIYKLTDNPNASCGPRTPRQLSTSTKGRPSPLNPSQQAPGNDLAKPRSSSMRKSPASTLPVTRPSRMGTYGSHSRHQDTPSTVPPQADYIPLSGPDQPAPSRSHKIEPTESERHYEQPSRRSRRPSDIILPSSVTGSIRPKPQPQEAQKPVISDRRQNNQGTVVVTEPFVERGIHSQRERGLQVEHFRTGRIVSGQGIRVVEVCDNEQDRPESQQASLSGERSQASTPSIRERKHVQVPGEPMGQAGTTTPSGLDPIVERNQASTTPSGLDPIVERSQEAGLTRGPIVRSRLRAAELERERAEQRKWKRLQQVNVPEQERGAADVGRPDNAETNTQPSKSDDKYVPWWEKGRRLVDGRHG